MNESSILDAKFDSMLDIERKDKLINACRNVFIERDFSCLQESIQEDLNAIFKVDNTAVPESSRMTLGMHVLLLAKVLNDENLKFLGNQIIEISDKATLLKAFELVKKRLQETN